MKKKYNPGKIMTSFVDEERLFMLKWARTMKASNDLEGRIIKRVLGKILGLSARNIPDLYPPKECPLCERTFSIVHFETHYVSCKRKNGKSTQRLPDIDPVVWEMMQ